MHKVQTRKFNNIDSALQPLDKEIYPLLLKSTKQQSLNS